MSEDPKKDVKGETIPPAKKSDEDLDLDDDLADAMGGAASAEDAANIDNLIALEDPGFQSELQNISADDFKGVVITTENSSEEINENEKAPSAFRAYVKNLPKEYKFRFNLAMGLLVVMIPVSILIYNGFLLPRFNFPFLVSMEEVTQEVYSYETDTLEVPLFDDFRSKSFSYEVPKSTINLRSRDGEPSYGDFEFFLNLRDEELSTLVDDNLAEIREIIQGTLEEMSWEDLQTPLGKEKAKKALRHRINELLQQNAVLGVYYRSVILNQ